MGLNGSYIFTEMEVDYIQGTTRESQLEGASPFIGNFDISYNVANNERNALISLVFTYISRRIHTIGMLGFKDIVGEGGGYTRLRLFLPIQEPLHGETQGL